MEEEEQIKSLERKQELEEEMNTGEERYEMEQDKADLKFEDKLNNLSTDKLDKLKNEFSELFSLYPNLYGNLKRIYDKTLDFPTLSVRHILAYLDKFPYFRRNGDVSLKRKLAEKIYLGIGENFNQIMIAADNPDMKLVDKVKLMNVEKRMNNVINYNPNLYRSNFYSTGGEDFFGHKAFATTQKLPSGKIGTTPSMEYENVFNREGHEFIPFRSYDKYGGYNVNKDRYLYE